MTVSSQANIDSHLCAEILGVPVELMAMCLGLTSNF